mmetsp:Transcript_12703/g.36825  ORF Transcript_12703/g.36825 Transcript_12703/m.36825 type:complete len:205 (-) Transcript_12703:1477-2091(-)
MTMRATQKKRMSRPVSRSVVGKKPRRSAVLSGHPMTENGKRPELNHVSSTSSSCSRRTWSSLHPSNAAAFVRASASDRPTTQRALCASLFRSTSSGSSSSLVAKYAGMRCPHQSWRDTHQGREFSSHWNQVLRWNSGRIFSSPERTASHARLDMLVQSTNHCGMTMGSMMSPDREQKPRLMGLGYLFRSRPFASRAFSTAIRAS